MWITHVCMVAESTYLLTHICPSVHTGQLVSHWMDICEIWHSRLLLEYVKIIQIWLKSHKNTGHLALRFKSINVVDSDINLP